MFSLTPDTTPHDAQGAFAVISLLTDDNKYKLRLKELMDTIQSAQQIYDTAKVAEQSATQKVAEAETKMAEVQQLGANATAREQEASRVIASTEQKRAELSNLIDKTREDATKAQAEYQQLVADANQQLNQFKADIEAERARSESAAKTRQTELDVVAQALRAREAAVLGRENAATEEAARLKHLADSLEARISKLRSMVNE
jgi:chromosome segregation ATPase